MKLSYCNFEITSGLAFASNVFGLQMFSLQMENFELCRSKMLQGQLAKKNLQMTLSCTPEALRSRFEIFIKAGWEIRVSRMFLTFFVKGFVRSAGEEIKI